MNSQLNTAVVVVSTSDIILTGLAEILKNSLAGEIILLHRPDEVFDYPHLSGNMVVIATSGEIEKTGPLFRQVLSSVENMQFLLLNIDDSPNYSNLSISLNDTPALICYKVNEMLNSLHSDQSKDSDTELTKREIEVLQLVTKGYSNKEIADHLFVSIHTVISHRKNISEKTGIKSASGLTMYAILKKIIDVNDINTADLI